MDHFQGRILFVQIGGKGDHHPPLSGTLDLRGSTDVRQLIRLVHHSAGVLCPVTGVMHLAAAVPVREGHPQNRPCVVVAGGREPSQWEAYPHHQFLHTLGALRCCDNGGCWKSRTVPLRDGTPHDQSLCLDVVHPAKRNASKDERSVLPITNHQSLITSPPLPRCMSMITPADVIRAIERYHEAGSCRYLTARQCSPIRAALSKHQHRSN